MLYAPGYRMSRSAQGSQRDSGDYSKYIFHVYIASQMLAGSTGLLSIDKQGYISHITAVASNLPFKQRF